MLAAEIWRLFASHRLTSVPTMDYELLSGVKVLLSHLRPKSLFGRRYVFTIVSYLIGVFIFATIVGQVGNVITNRNANRLEFERLLDGAKTYMRHHKQINNIVETNKVIT
ncbi:Cyclic nucleotide-gated cation channel alpha-3 [Operophtera brumata]|uniref:Cyclic nucleotide-gated cation channel alpha-3 n=1 Tax=Operophtera brumata TaxID=104452 RepID=A0A0L7KNY3_OPEBR|nr:Cyclic nucleotide-gated cation channel alpha-3 [Operophtera brumata]